jgi:hypothetical protein
MVAIMPLDLNHLQWQCAAMVKGSIDARCKCETVNGLRFQALTKVTPGTNFCPSEFGYL